MNKNAPIGVIDSGVGGLSVLKCLHRELPGENFIYLGDTARTPYGTRSESQVRLFVGQMLDFLERQQVKMVVVACNTITVLGLPSLQVGRNFLVAGMSKGEDLVLQTSKNKKIGVCATEFTVRTGAHRQAITGRDASAQVYAEACPEFVPLIEGERFDSEELKQAVALHMRRLQDAGVDTVLLACTHYPFIKDKIEAFLGPQVAVLDPAEVTAAQVGQLLREHGLERAGSGKVLINCTADLARVKRLAAHMLPQNECMFQQVEL